MLAFLSNWSLFISVPLLPLMIITLGGKRSRLTPSRTTAMSSALTEKEPLGGWVKDWITGPERKGRCR